MKDPQYKVSAREAFRNNREDKEFSQLLLMEKMGAIKVPRAQQNSLKLTRPSWFSSISRKIQRESGLLAVQKDQGSKREKSKLNWW